MVFIGVSPLLFALDFYRHAHLGVVLLEVSNIGIAQPDAPLAVTPGHFVGIASATMNADARKWGFESHEPWPIREYSSTTIAKVVGPCACIYNLSDNKGLASWRLRSCHVAIALFLPLLASKTHGVACNEGGVALHSGIDVEAQFAL